MTCTIFITEKKKKKNYIGIFRIFSKKDSKVYEILIIKEDGNCVYDLEAITAPSKDLNMVNFNCIEKSRQYNYRKFYNLMLYFTFFHILRNNHKNDFSIC